MSGSFRLDVEGGVGGFGFSQLVSPVVGLCQYGSPDGSSTISSHSEEAEGGGGRVSGSDNVEGFLDSLGFSQLVSPLLELYQYELPEPSSTNSSHAFVSSI